MHGYEINSSERHNVQYAILIFSLTLMYFAHPLLESLNVPFWIELPSLPGIYALTLWLFEQYLWKVAFFRSLLGVETPLLAGTWEAELSSSFDNHAVPAKAKVTIEQTWRKIFVTLDTNHSLSESLTGSINVKSSTASSLTYNYLNKPKSGAPATMVMHEGTCQLYFGNDLKSISGDYFSGRGRQNHGTIYLNRP